MEEEALRGGGRAARLWPPAGPEGTGPFPRAAAGARRCPGPSARRGRGAGAAPRAPAPRQLRARRGGGGTRGGGGGGARGGRRAFAAGQDGAGRPAELLAAPRVEQRVEGRERAEQQPAGGLQRRRRRAQEEAQEAHPDQGLGAQQEHAAEQQDGDAAEAALGAARRRRRGGEGQLVQQVEVEDADPLGAAPHPPHDAEVAVEQQRGLAQHGQGEEQGGVARAAVRLGRAQGPEPGQQRDREQGEGPGEPDHAARVSPLVEGLVHAGQLGDEHVPVESHQQMRGQGDGEAEAQEPPSEQPVLRRAKGGGIGGQQPQHSLLGHPQGAHAQVRRTAVHDEGIAGCLQLLEGED